MLVIDESNSSVGPIKDGTEERAIDNAIEAPLNFSSEDLTFSSMSSGALEPAVSVLLPALCSFNSLAF